MGKNIEIQSAKKAIVLLKKIASAKTQDKRNTLLEELQSVYMWAYKLLKRKNYDPRDLATKMERALELDQYRPKNMAIAQLATSKDLEYINGEFDTFDPELQKMFKNNEKPDKIREAFRGGTANIYVLAKQFSADWIDRLNNHKDLVDAARDADDEHAVDAYDKLFYALTQDFCKEHNCHIISKVITDWATSDEKPEKKGWNYISGYHVAAHGISLPNNLPESEKNKIIAEAKKHPLEHPDSHPLSLVYMNINVARKAHPDQTDFFYYMISAFAHEMHHALDYQQSRQGALGPQIAIIDNRIYVPPTKSQKKYGQSATEISSYEIQYELYNQLKNIRY